jgi:hypothetical protein
MATVIPITADTPELLEAWPELLRRDAEAAAAVRPSGENNAPVKENYVTLATLLDSCSTVYGIVSGCHSLPYWYGQRITEGRIASEATNLMLKKHKYTDVAQCCTTLACNLLISYVLPAPLSTISKFFFMGLSFSYHCHNITYANSNRAMQVNAVLQLVALGLQLPKVDSAVLSIETSYANYAHLLPELLPFRAEVCAIASVAFATALFLSYRAICKFEKACIESFIDKQTESFTQQL